MKTLLYRKVYLVFHNMSLLCLILDNQSLKEQVDIHKKRANASFSELSNRKLSNMENFKKSFKSTEEVVLASPEKTDAEGVKGNLPLTLYRDSSVFIIFRNKAK